MTSLPEFLLTQIEADEAAILGQNRSDMGADWVSSPTSGARVLRECAAKRAIVEAHPIITGPRILPIDSTGTNFGCETCHCIDPIHEDGIIEAVGYCDTLRALVSVYADREGFDAGWLG